MPKMKTHKGAKKRFSVTGSGKVRRLRANKSHILTKKDAKRKRRLRQPTFVATNASVHVAMAWWARVSADTLARGDADLGVAWTKAKKSVIATCRGGN